MAYEEYYIWNTDQMINHDMYMTFHDNSVFATGSVQREEMFLLEHKDQQLSRHSYTYQ